MSTCISYKALSHKRAERRLGSAYVEQGADSNERNVVLLRILRNMLLDRRAKLGEGHRNVAS
jgi:hypothetical protein